MDSVSSLRQTPQEHTAAPLRSVSLGASVEQRIAGFVEDSARRLELPADAAQWQAQAAALRARCSELLLRGHPAGVLDERPEVVWGDTLQPAPEYRIRKLRFEGYPGVWVPALWYEPVAATGRAPVPAVLNSNGHHAGGVAMDYKQARCINLAKRGMLALSFEFLGMGGDRQPGGPQPAVAARPARPMRSGRVPGGDEARPGPAAGPPGGGPGAGGHDRSLRRRLADRAAVGAGRAGAGHGAGGRAHAGLGAARPGRRGRRRATARGPVHRRGL